MKQASVLIMAGGKSERMGSPKPFLLIDGMTFIEKISSEYQKAGIKNIFLVLNHNFLPHLPTLPSSLTILPNYHPEYGRFYSFLTGFQKIQDHNYTFIHNVDNPYVDCNLIKKMWSIRKDNGFVVPIYNEQGGHPILISNNIKRHILSTKNLSVTLRDVLRDYKRIEVKTDSKKILTNINTWNEYEEEVLNLIPEYYSDRYLY